MSTTTTVTHPDGTVIACSTSAVSPPASLKLMYVSPASLAASAALLIAWLALAAC